MNQFFLIPWKGVVFHGVGHYQHFFVLSESSRCLSASRLLASVAVWLRYFNLLFLLRNLAFNSIVEPATQYKNDQFWMDVVFIIIRIPQMICYVLSLRPVRYVWSSAIVQSFRLISHVLLTLYPSNCSWSDFICFIRI